MGIQQEIWKLEIEISHVQRKLQNESFVERAPEYIVDEEREKLENLQKQRQLLLEKL